MGQDSISRKVIDAVSMGADITGATGVKPLAIRGKKTGSFQIDWTAGPAGTWKFYVSDRPEAVKDGVPDLTKFQQLPQPSSFSTLQPNGSNTGAFFTFADLAAEWILPFYTRTSGTGTANAWGMFF